MSRAQTNELEGRPKMHTHAKAPLTMRMPFRSSRGIVAATVLLFALSAVVQPASLSSSALAGLIPFAAVACDHRPGANARHPAGRYRPLRARCRVAERRDRVVLLERRISAQPFRLAPRGGLRTRRRPGAGAVNGFLVSKVRVAPIVTTLGMNALLYGVNVSISGGTPVQVSEILSQLRGLQDLRRFDPGVHRCGVDRACYLSRKEDGLRPKV